MGLRLELFLVALIIGTSIYMMSIKLKDHNRRFQDDGKELEFYDTTFTEVNESGLINVSYGVKGERVNGILTIDGFRYKDTQIVFLRSQHAKKEGHRIFLDGKVRLKRYDGFKFQTEHARYDTKRDIIEATAPFVAYKAPNTLLGDTMYYDMKRKRLYATHVRVTMVVHEERNATKKQKG